MVAATFYMRLNLKQQSSLAAKVCEKRKDVNTQSQKAESSEGQSRIRRMKNKSQHFKPTDTQNKLDPWILDSI